MIRAPTPADLGWILALSSENEIETSALDEAGLAAMLGEACHARVADPCSAYLICFDETAGYASPNYRWFRDRRPRFIYVDRIVVAASARGRGLARALYEDLFAAARAAGQGLIACEVNLDPPNPASDAFHARLGFAEAGRATLANGKTVRYLTRAL